MPVTERSMELYLIRQARKGHLRLNYLGIISPYHSTAIYFIFAKSLIHGDYDTHTFIYLYLYICFALHMYFICLQLEIYIYIFIHTELYTHTHL